MDRALVIGSGGREHAFTYALSRSPGVEKVFCAPGSDAISQTERCESVPIEATNFKALSEFAKERKINLTLVGPEAPLVQGISDVFTKEGLPIIGPNSAAAQLEGDKIFAKDFFVESEIPTAGYRVFRDYEAASAYVKLFGGPVYVKYPGLAGGKGSIDGSTIEKAQAALKRIFVDKEFGKDPVAVIESHLEGEEASYIALVNSTCGTVLPLVPSQDHKKLNNDDEGPNTGGMGAYAPTTLITPELDAQIQDKVFQNTLRGLKKRNLDFLGFDYSGLMIKNGNIWVLEKNVRGGDPETQALVMLYDNFYEICQNTLNGKNVKSKPKEGYAVCVVLTSRGYGYPGTPEKGKLITGLEDAAKLENVYVFHAGTKLNNGNFYTNGGRVLGVTAYGPTISIACDRAYEAVDHIQFEGMHFRTDIGDRELKRK